MEEDLSEVAAEVRASSSLVEAKKENLFFEELPPEDKYDDEIETNVVSLPLVISELDLPLGGNQAISIDGFKIERKHNCFPLFYQDGWKIHYLIGKTRCPVPMTNGSVKVSNGDCHFYAQVHNNLVSDLQKENFMDLPGTFKYNYGCEYNYKLDGSSFDMIKQNKIMNRVISSLQFRASAREVDQFRIFFKEISVRGFKLTPVYSIDEDLYQEFGFRIERNRSHFYSVDVIRCLKALFEEIHGTTILRLFKIVLGFTNDFKITFCRRILAMEQKTISLASSFYFQEVQHQNHNWVDESSLQSLNLDIELRQRYGRCRQEKYGLGIGYYFYLNSSYNAILFRYYSCVGNYKFVLPITYDIETADTINPNLLFSFVSLPIIGASFYRYYKEWKNDPNKKAEESNQLQSLPKYSLEKIGNVSLQGFGIEEAFFRGINVKNALMILLKGRSKVVRADDYSFLPGFSQTRSEEVLNSIKETKIKDELNILFYNDSAVHKLTAQNGAKLDFNIQVETISRNIRL